MFKIKFKASLIHFAISAVVLSLILALVALYWFPSPFLGISNFKEITILLISVDLVLGPLLTFVAFNPAKKSLKLDLATIAVVQIVALSYGLYSLYLSHPLYVTYHDNAFNLVTANFAKPDLATNAKFKVSKLSSPTIAYLDADLKEKQQLFADLLNGGADVEARADYYEPVHEHLDKIIMNALVPERTFKDEFSQEKLNQFISKNGNAVEDYIFVPLMGDGKKVIWALNKKTGNPVDTIDL